MKLFGLQIGRKKAAQFMTTIDQNRGTWLTIFDSHPGAWQQDVKIDRTGIMAQHAVWSCTTLIASDIGKMPAKLMEQDEKGIWAEVDNPAFSPVLRKPNHFQNHLQFRESWTLSRLMNGNTYALKERDGRGVVVALYVLDPSLVTPLVTPDGSVYYQLSADNLSGVTDEIIVPASEIIHDRMNCLFHPLVGLSPIFACGLSAMQGLAIQKNSTNTFNNMSRPSGILIAPGSISKDNAAALAEKWNTNYSGANAGKIAVLGDGLKFEKISMTADEMQLIDQLKMTAEIVCSCFHVPPFKAGFGATPTYQNAETLNQIYYTDCLQSHIEHMEAALDEGLGLDKKIDGRWLGVELDIDAVLRMDTATKTKTLADSVSGAIMTPNEARAKMNLRPLTGGDTVYMQQQDYAIEALAQRDKENPLGKKPEPPPADPAPQPALPPPDEQQSAAEWQRKAIEALERELAA